MAGTFPTLKSGNTVFYPLEDTQSFGTGVLRFMDNSEQRWRSRLMLRQFKLAFNNINAYDVALILQFYRSQFGRFDSTWSLVISGTTYANLSFDTDSFKVVESKRNRFSITFNVIQVKSDVPTIPAATVYFPQINSSGIMTALPYTSSLNYRTTLSDMDMGKRYTYKWQTNPIGKWSLNLPALTDAELLVVQNFFYSMEGRKGEFKFMDPGGNLATYSDDFSNAAWTKTDITVGSAQTDPKGGSLATRMTSTSANGMLVTTVIPDGGASGFVVCASIWARASSSSQQLSIGFIDSAFNVLGNTTWDLPVGQWIRIHHSMTLTTASYIRILIGGFATWGSSQAIDLFSGQCSPMLGPGPRLLTPGMDGLRPKCRFDTDDFVVQYLGPNEHSVTLPIVEYI